MAPSGDRGVKMSELPWLLCCVYNIFALHLVVTLGTKLIDKRPLVSIVVTMCGPYGTLFIVLHIVTQMMEHMFKEARGDK